MTEENKLPALSSSGASKTLAPSSLVDRGLAGLRQSSKEGEAEKLYQEAMTLCLGVDFIAMSEINSPFASQINWDHHPALDLLTKAAALGHRDSMFCLGAIFSQSKPLATVVWYEKAAHQGHPDAAYQFVKYLYLAPPEKRSPFAPQISFDKACDLLEVAAREKHAPASRELGLLLLKQAEDEEDRNRESLLIRASLWFRQAAEAGEADAAFQYAELLSLGDGTIANHAEAARWYAVAVEQGHRKAMVELAYLFELGRGVSIDKVAAAELYKRAGKIALDAGTIDEAVNCFELARALGDPEATTLLTKLYKRVGNLALDEERFNEAISWFEKASALNDAEASYLVGCAIFQQTSEQSGATQNYADIKDALIYWENAANNGHILAAYALAGYYRDKDKHLADKWLENAAVAGHTDAQFQYGNRCEVDDRANEAVCWYRKAAEQGHVEAAYQLALILRWGRDGFAINEKDAARWMVFSADNGHINACFYSGWMLNKGFGVERDDARAVAYYRKAAEDEHAGALTNLGYMFASGFGVEKDGSLAAEYYERAAILGDAIAKNNLAYSYKDGIGIEANPDEALYWMTEAAEEDEEPLAQYNLGRWYQTGEVVEQDDVTALYWIEKAAAQGHVDAINYAGWMREYGKGCAMDLEKAISYYLAAAELGNECAQCNVATMYELGRGVDKSLDEAIRWYRLAARQMHQRAIDALKRLGVDIHGPVTRPAKSTITSEVKDRVHKALENVLGKDSVKLTHRD